MSNVVTLPTWRRASGKWNKDERVLEIRFGGVVICKKRMDKDREEIMYLTDNIILQKIANDYIANKTGRML